MEDKKKVIRMTAMVNLNTDAADSTFATWQESTAKMTNEELDLASQVVADSALRTMKTLTERHAAALAIRMEREKRGYDDPYGLKTQDGRRLVIHLEITEFGED